MKSAGNIRLLSLNCWGLPVITPHRRRRLDGIADQIKSGNWDVVALQEVWLPWDQKRLIEKTGFPHVVQFKGGTRLLGSGMILLSKYPILQSGFHPFRVTGFPHRIFEGDFHSTKGVGYALINTPVGLLPIFVTHLIANYSLRAGHDPNRVFRMAQILELIFYIRKQATPSGFVICGDFNATDEELELESFKAIFDIRSSGRLRSEKKRIDHIFAGATGHSQDFRIQSAKLEFRGFLDKRAKISFSDHQGISAIIRKKNVPSAPIHLSQVLERTFRYMKFSMDTVTMINRRVSWIPIIGWFGHFYMKPQLAVIETLLGFLEAEIKLHKEDRAHRLKSS